MNILHLNTDAELVELVNTGSEAAFAEIYRRYWNVMYQSGYNVLRDKDAALDIVQDVFVWVWNHRASLRITSLKAYLLCAVKYKIANYIRHEKAFVHVFDELQKFKPEDVYSDCELEVKELKEVILRFTDSLPGRSRTIFDLSRNQHLSNKEIAKQMGISEKTVENQMTITLKKLRISLGKITFWMLFLG
jgi:RNA polymerase sigma-70 factor (family 1)